MHTDDDFHVFMSLVSFSGKLIVSWYRVTDPFGFHNHICEKKSSVNLKMNIPAGT